LDSLLQLAMRDMRRKRSSRRRPLPSKSLQVVLHRKPNAKEMSEIMIRCVVVEPVSDD
jgi:hypothetical protein